MTNPTLFTHPVHLGLGAKVVAQPEFTGLDWYPGYVARTLGDGAEGRLVSYYTFSESWDMWEMHPAGEELVLCVAGQIMLHQEDTAGSRTQVTLGPGDYAINPRGVWHTADVAGEATVLFITAGVGTQQRPR